MTLVIGLCGPAGSGKTTVAKYLERHYGARRYALADPLKVIIQRAFAMEDDQLWGPQRLKEAVDERYNVSPRWLMQHIGTDGIRSVMGDDFWVKFTLERIQKDGPSIAVVEDVRFLSEDKGLAWMRNRGWYWSWKLPASRRSDADPTHQSESEWELVETSYTLAPTETLEALYHEVDKACAHYNIRPLLNAIEAP